MTKGYIENVAQIIDYADSDIVSCENTADPVELYSGVIPATYLTGSHQYDFAFRGGMRQDSGSNQTLTLTFELEGEVLYQDVSTFADYTPEVEIEIRGSLIARGDAEQRFFADFRRIQDSASVTGLGTLTGLGVVAFLAGIGTQDGNDPLTFKVIAEWGVAHADVYIYRRDALLTWS